MTDATAPPASPAEDTAEGRLPGELELLGTLTVRRPQPVARQRELLGRVPHARLVEAAGREGLAGMLYANLRRGELLARLPAAAGAELEAAYFRTAALNLHKQADLRSLAPRLARAATPVLVLKGMALLDTLYDDPGQRATGDVDLYVPPAGRDRLAGTLCTAGFAAQRFYPDTFRRGSTDVDVHTHLLGAERIRARAAILAAGEAPLLARRVPTSYGAAVSRLADAPALLLACLHFMKHNADRLLWLIEINERVAALDAAAWQELVALCTTAHQRSALTHVAWLAGLMLPHTMAPTLRAWAGAQPPPPFARRTLARRVTRGALPPWGPLLFFSAHGPRARAASMFETLFPRPPVLRQVFADDEAAAWRLYLRRLGQLVSIALR